MTAFDVAIVGAGAAGMAAAHRLVAAGRRVILLEARDHVGGRARLDHHLGVPVDLGAAWLHFADQNAWTPRAIAGGFTVLRDRPGWGASAHVGAHAPTPDEQQAATASFGQYEARVTAAAVQGRDVPVSDVLPHDAFRPRYDAVMTWAVGRESHEISTVDVHRYAESELNWGVHEGLAAVVIAAAHELPVQLGAQVTAIDWRGSTLRLDSSAGRIEAAAVIVTLPTSLLAADAIRFDPPLPLAHREALAALPLGVCNKVFFRIGDGLAAELPRFFIGSAQTSRTCSWQTRAADQPVLLAYFGGDLSWELEQHGELADFARQELHRMFGADLLRTLGPSLSTAWGTDAFARGSYSAALPGHAQAREQLAAAVSPRLLIAGEACDNAHYGTLHGAWLSGTAAAERLLTLPA